MHLLHKVGLLIGLYKDGNLTDTASHYSLLSHYLEYRIILDGLCALFKVIACMCVLYLTVSMLH